MIVFNLVRAGFEVQEAGDSRSARIAIAEQRPDLVLIDWMLPDTSGLELTRMLKREEVSREIAIIMLTAKAAERDKILGLEGGADDYITKPFSSKELLARIKAVLRRTEGSDPELIVAGKLMLDPVSHRVRVDSCELSLGPTEYRLLRFLMAHPDRVYSRAQLLDSVWGQNVYVEERTVDVHIRSVRKALEPHDAAGMVQTVRGAGYRFCEPGN
jgi:two-component system phosphate regulon response regulator PhoB